MTSISQILFYEKNKLIVDADYDIFIIMRYKSPHLHHRDEVSILDKKQIAEVFAKHNVQNYTIRNHEWQSYCIIFRTREDYVYAKLALSGRY